MVLTQVQQLMQDKEQSGGPPNVKSRLTKELGRGRRSRIEPEAWRRAGSR